MISTGGVHRSTAVSLAVVVGLAIPAAAGCSSGGSSASVSSASSAASRPPVSPSSSIVLSYHSGLPSGSSGGEHTDHAVWGASGQVLIVIYGSSTCPRLPSTVTSVDPNTIKVTTEVRNGNGPCTMDLVPGTAAVGVPDGINDRQAVTISIDGHTSVLAPR